MVNALGFAALLATLGMRPVLRNTSPGQDLVLLSSNSNAASMIMKSQYDQGGDLSSAQEPSDTPSTENNDCDLASYVALPIAHQEFEPFMEEKATVYRYRRQQSVNMGSWYALAISLCC